jgi:hypothetical protein
MLHDNLPVPSSRFKNPKRFLNPEDWTNRLSWNTSNKLPLLTAWLRTAQFSANSWWKPEIMQSTLWYTNTKWIQGAWFCILFLCTNQRNVIWHSNVTSNCLFTKVGRFALHHWRIHSVTCSTANKGQPSSIWCYLDWYMNSNFQRSLLPSSSSKSKSLVTLPWGRRQHPPLKHLCICASLYSVIVCDGNFQILYYEAVCTLTSYHALFCNLIHLPNKLFLVVCCYKTQLIFYLQKFTLNFLQNYLDLCRFWVQDKQIWELMKIWKS